MNGTPHRRRNVLSLSPSTESEVLDWLDTLRGCSQEPEKRLMLAVLEDGLKVYTKLRFSMRTPNEEIRFQEAYKWLFGKRDVSWLYSFHSICVTLCLEENYVLKMLSRWEKRERVRDRMNLSGGKGYAKRRIPTRRFC